MAAHVRSRNHATTMAGDWSHIWGFYSSTPFWRLAQWRTTTIPGQSGPVAGRLHWGRRVHRRHRRQATNPRRVPPCSVVAGLVEPAAWGAPSRLVLDAAPCVRVVVGSLVSGQAVLPLGRGLGARAPLVEAGPAAVKGNR